MNCVHKDEYGSCCKYSTLDVDIPCPSNGDCDGYEEVEEDGKAD